MQPMPETCLLGPQETVTISPQPDQASPIPVHRSKRRRRTVKEGSLHGNVTQSQMNMNCDTTYEYNTQKPTNNNSCSVISYHTHEAGTHEVSLLMFIFSFDYYYRTYRIWLAQEGRSVGSFVGHS